MRKTSEVFPQHRREPARLTAVSPIKMRSFCLDVVSRRCVLFLGTNWWSRCGTFARRSADCEGPSGTWRRTCCGTTRRLRQPDGPTMVASTRWSPCTLSTDTLVPSCACWRLWWPNTTGAPLSEKAATADDHHSNMFLINFYYILYTESAKWCVFLVSRDCSSPLTWQRKQRCFEPRKKKKKEKKITKRVQKKNHFVTLLMLLKILKKKEILFLFCSHII